MSPGSPPAESGRRTVDTLNFRPPAWLNRAMALVLFFVSLAALLLWMVLLVACWPLAVVAALVILPLALAGMAASILLMIATGVVQLLGAILELPARVLGLRCFR